LNYRTRLPQASKTLVACQTLATLTQRPPTLLVLWGPDQHWSYLILQHANLVETKNLNTVHYGKPSAGLLTPPEYQRPRKNNKICLYCHEALYVIENCSRLLIGCKNRGYTPQPSKTNAPHHVQWWQSASTVHKAILLLRQCQLFKAYWYMPLPPSWMPSWAC
jgi:hypothetical protein